MPVLVGTIIAPAFAADPEKFDLTVVLTRIMFPYLFCMSLVAMLSGILNSMRRYFLAAIVPVLLRHHPDRRSGGCAAGRLGTSARRAGSGLWACLLQDVAQLLLLVWGVKQAGFSMKPRLPRLTPQVKTLLVLMGPAAFSHGRGERRSTLLVGQIISHPGRGAGAIALLKSMPTASNPQAARSG